MVMIRRAIVFAAVGLLLVASAARAQGPVKIGLLLPYTGVLSVQGIDSTNGFELALKKAGAKAGGREVQVLKEDTEAKPDVALTKVKKLVEGLRYDRVLALGLSTRIVDDSASNTGCPTSSGANLHADARAPSR